MNAPDAPRTPAAVVWALAAGTIVWRFVLSVRTPVPSGDGCSYLWIAQQFANGSWGLGLSEVFPPGFPMLVAPWLALGGDAWTTGLWLCLMAAALTVWPLVRIADHVRPGAGPAAGVLWLSSSLLARNAAEVFSEPVYLLVMAIGTLDGLRGRWWRCGIWSGLAFWIRPEGVLLAASFVLVERRRALAALVPVAVAVFALALLRWVHGHGFDPLPMLAFHVHERTDLPERGQVFGNLLQVPAAWAEAFGPVGLLPLLLLAPALRRRVRGAGALVWQVVLQIGAVCTFVTRRRFVLSAGVPVFALAGVALAALPVRWRRIVGTVLVGFGLVTAWNGVTDADRIAERRIGEYLGARLAPADEIESDLTRVKWFAGRRPLWPRHYTAAEMLGMATRPEVRFVVLSERSVRGHFDTIAAGLAAEFAPVQLPADLADLGRARGLQVFVRR